MRRLQFSAIVLAIVLAGCSEQSQPIRIGANIWPGYECLFLAQAKDFYREQGVEVELIEFGSLSDVRRAFELGQIDVASCTAIEVIQSREFSEREMRAFLVTDFSNGADIILAREGLTSLRALKGKAIGAEPASLGVFVLSRGLEEMGMTLADVRLVPMNQQEMKESFLAGEVDAVVTYPPVSAGIQATRKTETVFHSGRIPLQVVDVLAAEASLLEQRPAEIAAIARAWDQAVQFMRDHPDEAYAINAERQGVTPGEFARSLEGIVITKTSEQRNAWGPKGTLRKALFTARRVLADANVFTGEVDVDRCMTPLLFQPEIAAIQ